MTERLRDFIKFLNIQVSAFADSCNIKRPTLSQILNGRNQTINNNIIESIHIAYPQLSISWLLFGEGHMLVDGEPTGDCSQFDADSSDMLSIFGENKELSTNDQVEPKYENLSDIKVPSKLSNVAPLDRDSVGISSIQSKTISKIMIFYTDNSFESFSPDHR